MSPIIHIPLSHLSLSPRNARKTGGSDIADLAANIAANGVLQNLVVTEVAGDAGDRFEVIAGGRRLSALQLLAKEGRLPPGIETDGVPCRRVDDDASIVEVSTAENTIRAPLHPADQFDAFQAMVENGRSISDVAAHFGTNELTVRRRLRLANVAPELIAEYRAGRANLEQITALALTEDHEAQRQAWAAGASVSWRRKPEELRKALAGQQIRSTDYRVRFVGLDAYEAAGGRVTRDIFDDQGGGYVADEKLLDRLVEEKIAATVRELEAEGWSFVRVDKSDGAWKFHSECGQSEPKEEPRQLTAEESARADLLRDRAAAQRKVIEDAYGDDDYELDIEEEEEKLERIESELNALAAPIETWSDRQKAKAGCQVVLRNNGTLEINRGLIPRSAKAEKQVAAAVAEAKGEKAPAKTPELAELMIRRLTAHKTIALQAGLLANADVALAVLAHALLSGIWHHAHRTSGVYALNVSASEEFDQLDKFQFDDVTNSPHYAHSRDALQQLRDTLRVPASDRALLPWLLSQKREVVVSLLAAVAAYTVTAVVGRDDPHHPSNKLLEALDIDMADYWQPTAATFFSVVPKALAVEAITEAFNDKHPVVLGAAKMSKAEFAGAAEEAMQRSGWLPKPLRRPGYKPRTQKPAADVDAELPPAPKKATKPAKATGPKKPPAKPKKATAKTSGAKKPATKASTTKAAKKPTRKASR